MRGMENIFVTGATGFIGSHLVKRLLKEGYQVTVLLRKHSSTQYIPTNKVKTVFGDIRDYQSLQQGMEGSQVVFHNAALARDWGRKKDFHDINVKGTRNVLKAAKANNIKFIILTSTTGVLGEENCREAKSENFPYKPKLSYFLSNIFESDMNHYRYTKMLAERGAIDFCRKNNISLTIVRPTWVYGPREFHAGPYYFCQAISRGTRFFPGCRTNKFHVIYASDLVKAMILILKKHLKGIQVFNIGGNNVSTMDEFWGLFCKYLNKKKPVYLPKWLVYPIGFFMEIWYKFLKIEKPPLLTRARVGMCYYSNVYDISKAKKVLNYEAKTPLTRGIRTTVRWWKVNGYL